ncbi:MAG TPA: glycosyltransferase family 4 protein, partial [Candidatus Binatus sp.]|nr:glycosyltransferase family 4 protein [Candidatus Binatus sp.]
TTDRVGDRPARERIGEVETRRVRAYPASRDYYVAPGLPAAIRQARPDLVHLQGYHTLVAPLTMAAAVFGRIPFVVSFHSGGHASALRNRARAVQRLALRPGLARAERLIAVSRYELELFRTSLRLPAERFRLIRNGSSLPVPRTARAAGSRLVLSVGRLERYKGQGRLIAAWPAVLEQLPDARLRLVGSGPDEDRLRGLVGSLGLEGHVEIGSIPGADRQAMADVLGTANLAVLVSDYEAHPVAVMEALATGARVLVSRTSGLTELVDDGLVAGIEPGASSRELAAAIVAELARPPATSAVALPTWDDCAASLRQLYLEVLDGRPAGQPR